MAELFGWEVKKKESDKAKSFVAPSDEEGTLDIAGGAGFFGQYYLMIRLLVMIMI